jgi:hypothetical protein
MFFLPFEILPYLKMIANPITGSWLSVSGAKLYLNGSDSVNLDLAPL